MRRRPVERKLYMLDEEAVLGLSGTYNSLAYRVHEIEKHIHNSEQVYGLTSNNLARKSLTPIVITAGNADWGTELMICDGTVIESGSTVMKFDFNHIYLVAVGTANRYTILEFYYSEIGTAVACTFDFTAGTVEDMVVSAAHGLTDGDKIIFKAGAGALPAEINGYTTYYVINKAAGYFQVSLTSGGPAVVEFTDDGGACFWYPVNTTSGVQKNTQTLLTETFISAANANNDAFPIDERSPRENCNVRLFARGKAAAGANAITFFIGLHTYPA